MKYYRNNRFHDISAIVSNHGYLLVTRTPLKGYALLDKNTGSNIGFYRTLDDVLNFLRDNYVYHISSGTLSSRSKSYTPGRTVIERKAVC